MTQQQLEGISASIDGMLARLTAKGWDDIKFYHSSTTLLLSQWRYGFIKFTDKMTPHLEKLLADLLESQNRPDLMKPVPKSNSLPFGE
jgi:hypothetical protein